MPEISRFLGIVVTMYDGDHPPPHFHVRYGNFKAVISIDPYFEDGASGEVDIASIIEFTGVFEPLRDEEYFTQVTINPEIGTIVWPNNADLDPDVLHAKATGQQIPSFSVLVSHSVEK
jgi:hypothetical protein